MKDAVLGKIRHSEIDECILDLRRRLGLQFIDELGLRAFPALGEVFVDCRNAFAVCKPEILEFRIRVFLDPLAVDLTVMIYDQRLC